jgi:dTDP-4-amino-4,6-dideoxygalactose transaminase
VGLVVALEIFLEEGDKLYESQMETARYFLKELSGISGIEVEIIPNDETYHEHPEMPHVPRVLLQWDKEELGISAQELDEAMAAEDPPVFLRNVHYYNYYTNKEWRLIDTFYLRPVEFNIITERIKEIFSR